jgi:hypothetical protein
MGPRDHEKDEWGEIGNRRWDSPAAKFYRTSACDGLIRGSQAGRKIDVVWLLGFLPNVLSINEIEKRRSEVEPN